MTAEVTLTRGLIAFIDDCDVDLVFARSWHARPRVDGVGFYAFDNRGVRMHRLIMGVTDKRIVDHRDGDGLNNRRSNLRIGTQGQNLVNRRQTAGPHLRGVSPLNGRWRATIKEQGKQHHLGTFDTQEEAHAAYVAAAKRIHGDWLPESLIGGTA